MSKKNSSLKLIDKDETSKLIEEKLKSEKFMGNLPHFKEIMQKDSWEDSIVFASKFCGTKIIYKS